MAVDRGTYLDLLGDAYVSPPELKAMLLVGGVVSYRGKPISELSDDELLRLAGDDELLRLAGMEPRAAVKANRCAYCSRKHAAAAEMCVSCGAPL
ncbi:MAG: hypothetical protein KF821_09110 [Anaerolineales bacterium]|nr:hypothetical protein [Anaerolineales bacterium]